MKNNLNDSASKMLKGSGSTDKAAGNASDNVAANTSANITKKLFWMLSMGAAVLAAEILTIPFTAVSKASEAGVMEAASEESAASTAGFTAASEASEAEVVEAASETSEASAAGFTAASEESAASAVALTAAISEVSVSTEELLETDLTGSEKDVLPSYYDARDYGKSPQIRSQGTLGTCWALSCVSALEAALQPEKQMIFSADHLSMNNGFVITQNEGGDYHMIMAYLSGWYGPVLEDQDPYGDGKTEDGLQASVHVQEMRLLDGKTDEEIKQMILSYGPVQTSMSMDRSMTSKGAGYYNGSTFGFYCPQQQELTHDVLILGWDDHYSRENFAKMPEHDGAYICQNTWGEDFGDDGIFYVSYDDANIANTGIAYCRVEGTDNYDRIYQNDVCGWQGRQGYDTDSCWFSCVYTAQSEEQIQAVGFYDVCGSTDYRVYLVHDFVDDLSFDNAQLLTEGTLEESGYYTVELPEAELLKENERFAIAVCASTQEPGKQTAVEMKHDQYTADVTLEGKESYISPDGVLWENTQECYGTNVCLKVYTDDADGGEK